MNEQPIQPKIGIALGGGVVRGFAHLGVLQVLDEANIPIHFVAGASVGALMGYAYAAGMRPLHILKLAENIGWTRFASFVLPRRGFVSFNGIEKWLVDILGDLHFCDLARPFTVTTTDMLTGEAYIINSGRVAPAVQASCAVPGFVEPVEIEGHILGDGGISNNIPAAAVRELGADYVIGVDIFSHAYHRNRLGALAGGLAALEIMVRRSGPGLNAADVIITPDLERATYTRFSKRQELIDRGREAAERQLPAIQTAIAKLTQTAV